MAVHCRYILLVVKFPQVSALLLLVLQKSSQHMVGIAVAFCLQVSFAVAGHLELQIDCRCLFQCYPQQAAGSCMLDSVK